MSFPKDIIGLKWNVVVRMVKKVNRLFTILSCFILFFTFLVMKNDEINPNEQFSIRNENLNSISKVVNHIITPDLPFNISEVGQWDFNYQGVPYDVEVVLNKAFVACLTGGVYVFDISDPSSPIYLNNYVNNTRAYSIDIQDDLALIADTELGMVILNISNPFDIYEISHAELELCYDVRVQDNLAFAVDHRSGLYIYDISEPNQPVFLGSYVNSSMGCYNVFINDSYAYLTTNYGLHIINITNPSTPTSIVIYQKESIMEHVLVEGELGYLCTNTYDDLTILNLTDVYNPEILCQYALDG
ncbi:MAG: hypothetical protein FK731_05400, partial [Asgard group archaeon]|nr:hypothetical protein [Asgard group archaeon]